MRDDIINKSFLNKITPFKVALYGMFFWIILYLFASVNLKKPIGFAPFLYIIICYFFFIIGTLSLKKPKGVELVLSESQKSRLLKFLYVIIVLAFIGFIFRFIDKFYLRGISFSGSSLENRKILMSSGPSTISIFSAVLNPFSFLPLFIYYLLGIKKRFLFLLSLFLFFASSFEYIVLSSRSGLFVVLMFLFIYLFYFKKIKIKWHQSVFFVLILGGVGVFSTNIFIDRTTEILGSKELAVKHILTKAGYNYTIEPKNDVVKDITAINNETYQALKLGYVNFSQYYIHGFFEFGYLYNNYSKDYHYGAYSFTIFAKFFNSVFGLNMDLKEVQMSPPRVGVYTTFFGPVFIDFGWMAFVFMFLLGLIQKVIFNKAIKGKFYFLPLLFYMLIITFFMPVVNFITTAQGLYIITAFGLFLFAYSILNKKLIFYKQNGARIYIRLLK